MSIVEVRPCRPEDVSVVWTLILRLAEYEKLLDRVVGTEEALYRWLFDEPVIEVLVAELEGEVVGYALFFKNFSTFLARPGIWLEDLFVVPEHRGKGSEKS